MRKKYWIPAFWKKGLLLVLAIALTLGFTWEGKLDPNDFDNWEIVGVLSAGPSLVTYIIKNPAISSIEKVALLIKRASNDLLAYRYFENGRPYSFVFRREQEKYVEYKFSQEEIQRCMECHQDEKRVREI